MEFLIGIFIGYIVTWPSLIVMLCLGILFEHRKAHEWALSIGILAAIVSYIFFDVRLTAITGAEIAAIAGYVGGYFVIGFLWSIWRYKRHATQIIKEYKALEKAEYAQKSLVEYLKPSNMLDTLTIWVIVWPFSVIENISGDMINMVQTVIAKAFNGIYNRIYTSAVNEMSFREKDVKDIVK
jgi:hypothetical protein